MRAHRVAFALAVLSVQHSQRAVTAQADGSSTALECPPHSTRSAGGGEGARCVCEAGYEGVVAYSSLRGDYVSNCEEAGAAGGGGGAAGAAARMTSVHQWALPVEQDCYPSCATASQQFLYWSISLLLSTLSAFALASLVWLGCRRAVRPLLTSPAVLTFFPMLLGDFLFIGTYLPYHFTNVLLSLKQNAETRASDIGRVLDSADAWCEYQTGGAVISLHMQFFGLLLLGYSPYRIMLDTQRRRRSLGLRPRSVLGVIVVACVLGSCQVVILFLLGNTGSYRGLYCGAARWDQVETGGWLVCELSLMFILAATFFCKAAAMLASGQVSAARNPVEAKQHEQQVWAIMRIGILVMVSFTVTWMPYNITTVINILGGEPPVVLDMIAGWMAKVKPAADVILIHHLPVMVTIQQRIKRAERRATYRLAHKRVHVSHYHSSHRMMEPIEMHFTNREKRLLKKAEEAGAPGVKQLSKDLPPPLPAIPVVPGVPGVSNPDLTLEQHCRAVEQETELDAVEGSSAVHTNAVYWTSLRTWQQMHHILRELRENKAAPEVDGAHGHGHTTPGYLLDLEATTTSPGLGSDVIFLGGGKVVRITESVTGNEHNAGSGQTTAQTTAHTCKQKASISSSSDEDDEDELQAARRRRAARAQHVRP